MSKTHYCSHCGAAQERFYSVETVARMLDCSPQAIRNWIRDREIGFKKFGRMVRIPASEIEKRGEYYPTVKESVDELLSR